MKRVFAIVLALAMALALFGCTNQQAAEPDTAQSAAPGTDDAAGAGPSKSGEVSMEWEYEVTTETTAQEFQNDDGVLLATWSYERPVLGLKTRFYSADDVPASAAPEKMSAVCNTFNDRFYGYVTETKDEMPGLQAEAQEQYDQTGEEYREYFTPYANETTVASVYHRGDLVSVCQMHYDYWGGAHGGAYYVNSHFDLQTGEFITLWDMTDEPARLLEELRYNVLGKIEESGETEYYFDDYVDTVLAKEDFNVSFGEEGMTVYFDQYELAPYAMGLLEFTIPCAEFSRFLNERGERLLDLSLTEKTLGEYYEAEEMWYWFEGGMPMDYADGRSLPVQSENGTIDYEYYRVDVPGVTTLADLREKLLTRFSEELAEDRLDGGAGGEIPILREFDGVLYALPAGRGTDMYVEKVDYAIAMNAGETGGTVTATIFWRDFDEEKGDWVLTGETSAYEMPFEMTDSGARFTEFYTIL